MIGTTTCGSGRAPVTTCTHTPLPSVVAATLTFMTQFARIGTPPQEFDDIRVNSLAAFRCESCNGEYPNTDQFLRIQDGHRLCMNCYWPMNKRMKDEARADAAIEAGQAYADNLAATQERIALAPNYSLLDGVSVLEGITFGTPTSSYPTPITLTAGGAGVAITGVGVGFLSSDTLTCSNTNVTFTTPVIATSQLSFTSAISASGATPRGDYDILFNGNRFTKAIKVR